MKKSLLTIAGALSIMFSANAQTQVEGQVTMGAGYANNVFYNLADQDDTTIASNTWDIAFYRVSSLDKGIRINDGGKLSVFEASNNIADWSTISVTNEANWTQLYNSDAAWNEGAFDRGSAAFGWGNYNSTTHAVTGTVIFVVKKPGATGSPAQYTKVKIDQYAGGTYTFTYAKWDGTAWGADVTKTVANTSNTGKTFNYFSFTTEDLVDFEPVATEWDFLFTQYTTDYPNPGQPGTTIPYVVTGVLQSPNVKIAKTTDATANVEDLSANISVVGYDWKTFTGGSYTINTNTNYFVKRNNSDVVYKVNFTQFAGSSTGIVKFNIDNTATLSVEEVASGVSFDVYPNPSTDKIINVVYDIQTANSAQNTIAIYSLSGAVVYKAQANTQNGFYSQTLDLSHLSSGMYMLEFKSGDKSEMKKIILK